AKDNAWNVSSKILFSPTGTAPAAGAARDGEDAGGRSSGAPALDRSVRVDVSLLDELMNLVGELVIDPEGYTVTRNGEPIHLTATEFKLLLVMAQNPRRVFTRMQLMDRVHGYAFEGYERTIDAHIKNLRRMGLPSGPGAPAPAAPTIAIAAAAVAALA
ncbi:MAG: winged helix-turn-helix domain-containing protein, partial [Limnochordales bacterium]